MTATSIFRDYDIAGVSSEQEDWGAESLKMYDSSADSWRTEATGVQTVTLDLGEAVEDPVVLIYRANFAAINFKGNATNEWSSPDFSLPGIGIEEDPDHFIRKRSIKLAGFNHRYLRIEIPDQEPDGGAAYFEIGVVAIFDALEDFDVYAGGFEAPEMTQQQSEVINRFETNRKDVIPLAPWPVLEIQLSGTMRNSVGNRQKVNRTFGHPLRSLVFMDRSEEGNTWQVYLAQRSGGAMTMSEPVAGNEGVRRYAGTWETIL